MTSASVLGLGHIYLLVIWELGLGETVPIYYVYIDMIEARWYTEPRSSHGRGEVVHRAEVMALASARSSDLASALGLGSVLV